jgi:hypothetical protein
MQLYALVELAEQPTLDWVYRMVNDDTPIIIDHTTIGIDPGNEQFMWVTGYHDWSWRT